MREISFPLSMFSLGLAVAACNPTGGELVEIVGGAGGGISRGGSSGSGGVSSSGGDATGGAGGRFSGNGGNIRRDAGRDVVARRDAGRSDAANGGRDAGPKDAGAGRVDADNCTVGPSLTGGTQHCSSMAQGTLPGGFAWSVWSSGSGGCITTYDVGCAFKATWNNSGDFLARAGYQWSSTQTYDQLGTITADFAFKKSGSGGGYSYIGIYGWSRSPLVEFYIVDDWYTKPNPGSRVGTITVDGATYTVFKNRRTNAPSIDGTASFDQYFSVRQTARQCGRITVSQHFAEWERLGLGLGKMYEAKILAEAGGGSGTVEFTSASMAIEK